MVIDPGLARGIRRGYMRELDRSWDMLDKRWRSNDRRNVFPSVSTPKAFRRSIEQCRHWLRPLLSVTELQLEVGSRLAWLAFCMSAKFGDDPLGGDDAVSCTVVGLLRPAGLHIWPIQIGISGHAVDRVIQRAGVVTTPLRIEDIHAINAEFADLLHFAGPAISALTEINADEASELNVLLPSQHGFFLGDFDPAEGILAIKTFVDESRLWESERQALRELQNVSESELAVLALQHVAPHWTATFSSILPGRLREIWRHFGWRLAEEEKPGGLSDRAWRSRDAIGGEALGRERR